MPEPERRIETVGALLETTVICPVAAPAVVGLNCTESTTLCPGFSVAGGVAPLTEKPTPLMEPEVT
jgi:hypothetical protein